MNIARILYPIRTLGPGDRVGIWVCGCDRGCIGCSNPELWRHRDEYEISVSDVMSLIRSIASNRPIDGFTISGGEPFQQAEELCLLIQGLLPISDDILIYSGYTMKELTSQNVSAVQQILKSIAVLVDGPYREELNTGVPMRGSSNQSVIVLNKKYEDAYASYLENGNRIQNFVTADGVVSVGIHNKGFSN